MGCSRLESVSIPASVSTIGRAAFGSCSNLTEITIPSGVAVIASNTFGNCISLKRVSLPLSVVAIDDYAFSGCVELDRVTLPPSLMTIGGYAFSGCSTLQEVDLPPLLAHIGAGAFNKCVALTTVTIPANVASIGAGSFANCDRLAAIMVNAANTQYTSNAGLLYDNPISRLLQCPAALAGAISLPASTTAIADYAFSGAKALSGISLPLGLTSIGSWAFSGCSGLTELTIPAGVTRLPDWVCDGCTSLSRLVLPATIGQFSDYALYSLSACGRLIDVTVDEENPSYKSIDGVLFSKDGTRLLLHPAGRRTAVVIGPEVTEIPGGFFSGVFYGSFAVDKANSKYSSINGVLYDKLAITMIQVPYGKAGSLVVPAGVATISGRAFSGCDQITLLALPASLVSFEDAGYLSIRSLSTITVAEANTSFRVIDGVLYDKQLTSLVKVPAAKTGAFTIPATVTQFATSAYWSFVRCSSITAINVDPANAVFKSIDGLLYDKLGTTLIRYPSGIAGKAVVPAGVVTIGNYAFNDCLGLTSVTLPSSVRTIEYGAFNGSTQLTDLVFLGNAAYLFGYGIFDGVARATVYHFQGADGWTNKYGGLPTASSLPDAPSDVRGSVGNTQVRLQWQPPVNGGAGGITGYVVQQTLDNGITWTTSVLQALTSTSATVVGLTNSRSYVFRIAARADLGQGVWSVATPPITPFPLPSAPFRPIGSVSSGAVSLTWRQPLVTGGRRITDYVVQYSADSGATWTTALDGVSVASRATVRGLVNGLTYVFRVAASTTAGTGAFSASSTPVIPFLRTAIPAAPNSVTGVGSSGTVSLSWAASSSNAGGPIRDYVIQYRFAAAGSRWLAYTDGVTSANTSTVRRLVAGRSYIFRVAAKNLAGQGAFSSPSDVIRA